MLELQSLGYRYGDDCRSFTIGPDQSVTYLEVSYGTEGITSFFAKLGGGVNILYGTRQVGDSTKGWSFNEENILTGLLGTEDDGGIASLGVLIYQPECANKALGFDVDPQAGDTKYGPGVGLREEQNGDGTF